MTANHAVCCDKITPVKPSEDYSLFRVSPATHEPEDYRIGLFISWAKAKNLQVTHRDEKPGLDVPFCVGVHQRPYKPRHYVPAGWGEFAEIDQRLLTQQWITDVYGPMTAHRE
jgi:hypothetical protein